MPFGPAPLGLAYFAGVKLVGYGAAGYRINQICRTSKPHPAIFGLARTALGLVVGVAFGTLAMKLGVGHSEALFYLALAPVRMGEWLLILWMFYRRLGLTRTQFVGHAVAGSAWSYLLDAPAIMAVFVLPGGAWVC